MTKRDHRVLGYVNVVVVIRQVTDDVLFQYEVLVSHSISQLHKVLLREITDSVSVDLSCHLEEASDLRPIAFVLLNEAK